MAEEAFCGLCTHFKDLERAGNHYERHFGTKRDWGAAKRRQPRRVN